MVAPRPVKTMRTLRAISFFKSLVYVFYSSSQKYLSSSLPRPVPRPVPHPAGPRRVPQAAVVQLHPHGHRPLPAARGRRGEHARRRERHGAGTGPRRDPGARRWRRGRPGVRLPGARGRRLEGWESAADAARLPESEGRGPGRGQTERDFGIKGVLCVNWQRDCLFINVYSLFFLVT